MNDLIGKWLAVDPGQFDTLRMVFAHSFGEMGAIAIAVALSIAWVLGTYGSQRTDARRRLTLALLRGAALLLAFTLALQPEIRLLRTAPVRTRVPILIDTSRSMSVKEGDKTGTRYRYSADFAASLQREISARSPELDVRIYGFDEALSPFPGAGADPKWGPTTDLGRTLTELAEEFRGDAVAAIIAISDGADRGALRRQLDAPGTAPPLEALAGVPIYTVAPADPAAYKDIAVASIAAEAFGFVHTPLSIDVEIVASGNLGKVVPVTLASEQGVIATKQVTIKNDPHQDKVSFSITPRQTGTFVYRVSTPTYSDDVVPENNTRSFALKVIRDKVRVLHICGMPSWDERFLRGLLKSDPNVDLVSFFILRTPYDVQPYPQQAYSLIPFPTRELFLEALPTFDLVIFQNFAYQSYFGFQQDLYLKALRDFVVERGGGLVMIGGDQSFNAGGYQGTPLEEVLPVTVSGPADAVSTADFQMKLTPEGLRHPITTLTLDADANRKAWAALPPLPGLNLVSAKPGAITLSTHPTLAAGGRARPAIVVSQVGKGRSMAVTPDATWKWSLGATARGQTAGPYHSFWQNAFRWLVRDPDLKQVRLFLDEQNFARGEEVVGRVHVVQSDWKPVAGALVTLTARGSTPSPMEVPSGQTDEQGDFVFRLKPTTEGVWRLGAKATVGGRILDTDETVFSFAGSDGELDQAQIDPVFLETVASRSGGAVLPLDAREAASQIELPKKLATRIIGERRIPLWPRPELFLVLLTLLGLEWFWRRRWGLL